MRDNPDMYISSAQNDLDTNLTVKGTVQASEAGRYFKSQIEAVEREYGITFDEVRVDTSPFLRCLQTASRIAKEVQLNQIHVNYRVCETINQSYYQRAQAGGGIFPTLELKQKGPAELKEPALIGVDVIDTEDWY